MSEQRKNLQRVIQEKVFFPKSTLTEQPQMPAWVFDFRTILLQSEYLDTVAELFFDTYKTSLPFQVGGLETAAIPIVAAIVMKGHARGTPVNGFYIRKSRKKRDRMNIVEGVLTNDPIILVDDLINYGNSIYKGMEILKHEGREVRDVFTILRFRDISAYPHIIEDGIRLASIFSVEDFGIPLLAEEKKTSKASDLLRVKWVFKSANPNYFYVLPKSAPVIDDEKLYFGSDGGNFWALNQNDGTVAWKFKVGKPVNGKSIFSSPALHENTVYFGSYDGNIYALDTGTGKPRWINREADWVGSSPALAHELGLLFIGLEFGLWRKRGGIAAINLTTGEKVWENRTEEYTHGSPAYSSKKKLVAVGSNDQCCYLYDARSGALKWKFKTEGDIKASCAFAEEYDLVLFGSHDGALYGVSISSGELRFKFQTGSLIYSTPVVHSGRVYVTSTDKNLYALDVRTGTLLWTVPTLGRIFSTPYVIGEHIFFGSNDGKLYEIDALSGKFITSFQATERITNKIAYNPKSKSLFLPTFANEMYCLLPTGEDLTKGK